MMEMEAPQSVSIIIPCLNERENIPILVERLEALLVGQSAHDGQQRYIGPLG